MLPGGGQESVFIMELPDIPDEFHSLYLETAREKLPKFIRIVDLAPKMLISTNRDQKTVTIEPFVES